MNYQNIKHLVLVVLFSFWINLSFAQVQDTIKILAIGNSFSEDAAESYLDDLAKADGVKLIVGNMFIGGCSLETHWNNADGNKAAYSYRKITDGNKVTLGNQTLFNAIKDEDWDYITFQQVSQNSGIYNTYFPYLSNLFQYVKGNATNNNVKYALHQTWAYAANSTHSGFANYNRDQMQMYNAIINTVNAVSIQVGIDIIIPCGTAIQNGRSSFIGDNFNRDGYHLSYEMGRYTAGCTWYEKLLGKSVIGNSFIPGSMSKIEVNIAQLAAQYAVLHPNVVTSMADIVPGTTTTLSNDINIDFGTGDSSPLWNNISSFALGSSITELIDNNGKGTGITITINDAFGGINSNGPTLVGTQLNLTDNVSKDSFWGNASGVFSGKSEPTAGFLLSGLNVAQEYDFSMFAARSGSTDNRETSFTISGEEEQTVFLNASNNTTEFASVKRMKPKDDGTVSIKLGAGSNNTNEYKFYYINAMRITPSAIVSSTMNLSESNFRFYPIPVKTVAILETNKQINNIEIYNLLGNKVIVYNDIRAKNKELDLSNLNSGYYLLKFHDKSVLFLKNNTSYKN